MGHMSNKNVIMVVLVRVWIITVSLDMNLFGESR